MQTHGALTEARAKHPDGDVISVAATVLSSADPELLHRKLAPHVDDVADVIIAGAKAGKRTCLRIFADTLNKVGDRDALLKAMAVSVGAQSVQHLAAAAGRALDAEVAAGDGATLYAQAREYCRIWEQEHGGSET